MDLFRGNHFVSRRNLFSPNLRKICCKLPWLLAAHSAQPRMRTRSCESRQYYEWIEIHTLSYLLHFWVVVTSSQISWQLNWYDEVLIQIKSSCTMLKAIIWINWSRSSITRRDGAFEDFLFTRHVSHLLIVEINLRGRDIWYYQKYDDVSCVGLDTITVLITNIFGAM